MEFFPLPWAFAKTLGPTTPCTATMLLENLFIPISPCTHLLPTAAAWIFLLKICRVKRRDGHRADFGIEIRDKFHCLATLPLRCSCICAWKEVCRLWGWNVGQAGFPQSYGCWCSEGLSMGWNEMGHFQAGDRSSDGPSTQRQIPLWLCLVQAAPQAIAGANPARVPSALLAHPSYCCATDV